MTEAVTPAGAGARGWVEARTLAAHARCDEATLVAAIRDGARTAYRINGVLLVPAPAAFTWLAARGGCNGHLHLWCWCGQLQLSKPDGFDDGQHHGCSAYGKCKRHQQSV